MISKNTKETNLKEDYVIQVKGTQHYFGHRSEDDHDDKIEIDTLGSYTVRPSGKKLISYKDMSEDGEKAPFVTIVKLEDNKLTMTKSGLHTRLEIEPGQMKLCAYDTPYGAMTVGIQTHDLAHALDENGGSVYCSYSLYLNNVISSRNTLEIKVKKAKL